MTRWTSSRPAPASSGQQPSGHRRGRRGLGGQFLAQIIMAAATVDPAKSLKYVSAVFGRPAVRHEPMDIEVEAMHGGRSSPPRR